MSSRRVPLLTGALIAGMVLLGASAAPAAKGHRFPPVGTCQATRVAQVGARLEDPSTQPPTPIWDSGTSVSYANGKTMVSYEVEHRVMRWRKGDPVRLCVVALPSDCPPGDYRGIVYKATNLRTRAHWTAPDSEHMCGGA